MGFFEDAYRDANRLTEDVMGWFNCVDYLAQEGSGEVMWAEGGFPTMVEHLALGDSEEGLSGVKGAACLRRQADLDFAGGQLSEGDLCVAAYEGDLEEMRRLIEAGAKIDERSAVSDGGRSVSVGRGGG
ncbi:hypothetical protein T484DRAFT_1922217 [Baffinella frigidus]|nr:hypothetical protein T484DRAFT_1922217 [Cryptophyta sp. CCMP2293]